MYFRRFTAVCAVAFLGCLISTGQTPRIALSIDEAVRTALDANREYLAARERVAEAQALIRQAGLRPTPTLEVEAGSGAIVGSRGESEYSAAYFHTFETGNKRSGRVTIAQIGVSIAEAEVQERQRLLAADVKTRFIASVAEQLKLASVRALLPTTEESYKLTMRRVELGDAAPLEEQLLFAESNRVRAQQALFEAGAEAAVIELRTAIGLTAEQPLQVIPSLDSAGRSLTLLQLQEQALSQRPDLRIVRLLEQHSMAETELAQAEGKPDVTASARYTRFHSRFDQSGISDSGAIVPLRDADNIVTFGVSVPLFTRNRTEAAAASAQSRQRSQQLRREHLEQTIPQEVEAAYRRWNGAIRGLELLRTGVLEPSQKTLPVIREAYRLGQLRLFDVLNEQRRLVDLQLSFVDAQAEAARALVELERAVGGNLP